MSSKITRSSGSIGRPSIGGAEAVPANIVGPLRRVWDFTKKTAKSFAKNFKNPDEKEAEFLHIVKKDSDKWT